MMEQEEENISIGQQWEVGDDGEWEQLAGDVWSWSKNGYAWGALGEVLEVEGS